MEYIKSGPYYTWSIQLSESSVSLYTKNAFKFIRVLSADSNGVVIVKLKKKSECTCHDVMMPWCHYVIMSWCHDPWCHDPMMSWCHDIIMPWCHDIMMSWWHDYLDSALSSFRFKLLQFLEMNNPLIFYIKMDLSNILDYLIHGNESKITQIEESKSSGCSDNLVADALQKQPPEMFC